MHANHIALSRKETFEIDNRYVPIKPVGRGAYGVVCSAKQTSSSQGEQDIGTGKVAIKKVSCAFQNSTDSRRILREIKVRQRTPSEAMHARTRR